jgi:AsmA protein
LPRLLWLAGVLAVLALLVVFVLPFAARQLIGPDRLKSLTEQALTDALGRRATISGDVSIIFAPWLGLSMGPVAVADAPDFGSGSLFEAKRLEMTIRLLPLVSRRVSPGSVRIRDLAVHLQRDASGRSNWEDLIRPATAVATATSAPGWQVAPEPRDVKLENASIDYRDAATGRTLAVKNLGLKTGMGQPFNYSLFFRVEGFFPDAALDCQSAGKAFFDPPSGRLALIKAIAKADLLLSRPVVPGGATPVRVVTRATVDYDSESGMLALTDLDSRALGARLGGTATVAGLGGAPKANVSLALTADMAGLWRDILGLTPGQTPESLVAASAGLDAEARPVTSPDAVFQAAGAQEPGKAEMAVEATADASGLTVSSLRVRLPYGTVSASGTWAFGATPVLDAAVTVEDMDFAMLPLPAGRSTWLWPMPWVSGVTLDARLDLRRCAFGPVAVADAHATALSRGGRLRLYPFSALLPGGVVSLDATLDPVPGEKDGELAVDIRAALDPALPGKGAGRVPTKARITGRLDAAGAKGVFQIQSQNPRAAADMLGQKTSLPPTALESRGSFALSPGVGRLVARAGLTDLETRIAGTTVRGQFGWDGTAQTQLTFDLGLDTLDLDRLPMIFAGDGDAGGLRTEGRLRLEHVTGRGVEVRDVALSLRSGDGRVEGVVNGAELFGGKITGKLEGDASGRLTAALQLAGAEASRLPGLSGPTGLTGQVLAKATLETPGGSKGTFGPFSAAIEATSPQLVLGHGVERQIVVNPKAVLTLRGRDVAEGEDAVGLDASLAVNVGTVFGLRDVRLGASGPLTVDKTGRLKDSGPLKVEGAALWRVGEGAGRDVKIALTGPLAIDMAKGGFTAGDLRLEAGNLTATAKISRAAGETGPAAFSLTTGNVSPRPILVSWGVSLPAGLPADRLTKASLSVSGTADEGGMEVKRLALAVDDVNLTGHASVPKYEFKRGKWDLNLDRLDCDMYFPHQPSAGPPSLAELRKPLDLKFLRELGLDLRVAVGWFKKGNVTFDATTIMANARGGLFTFRQESPRFYGGRFFAEVRGDARDVVLKTFVELKLESIECARFLKDWAEGDTLSSGGATFILAARTSGDTEEQLRGNLAGNASLQITRGDLKMREPASKPGEAPAPERIPFDVFSSTWQAKSGVAHSEDFLIDGPRMRVAGKGFVDLRDETINLSVTAALPGGSQVPATIIGPLDNPKLTIDRSKIIGDTVYRILQGIISIPGKAVTRILQIR